jgi:uncharacterized protein (DUF4213/DUF364 family)
MRGNTIGALLGSVKGDAPIQQILVGAHWTAVVLDTDPPRCGLASTMQGGAHHGGFPVKEAGHLQRYSGRQLAELLRSDSTMEAGLGMAAFNALLRVDEAPLEEANAEQIILEQGTGGRIAIVGHFPFIERVRAAAAQCWVLELHPRPGDLPASRAVDVLPQADVVALTGTSLLNHTFDDLVGLCKQDAYILLLGPSAPLTPVLFEAGVDAISGTRVVDPERVLRTVGQGATFRQVKRGGGLRLLTWQGGHPDRDAFNGGP